MSDKKRNVWIDALRGLAIILVLLGHNNPPFIKYIYGFHMPLFFMVSGDLFKDSISLKEHLRKIVVRYLGSYWGLCSIAVVIYHLQVMYVTHTISIDFGRLKETIIGILLVDSNRMHGCFTLWFLPALAIALMIFTIITQVKIKIVRIVACVLVMLTGMYLGNKGIILPFKTDVAMVGTGFVGIGYVVREYDIIRIIRDRFNVLVQITIIIVATIIGYFAINMNLPGAWVDMSYSKYGRWDLFIIGAVCWTLVLMLLLAIVEHKTGPKMFRPLSVIGMHTLFIVGFDVPSNSTGGMILEDLGVKSHVWYVDFLCRCVCLAGYYLIYYVGKIIVKKITHR